MARQRVIIRVLEAGSAEASLAAAPRHDLVVEDTAGGGCFHQQAGPFRSYERLLQADGAHVIETTRYRLEVPWFAWLFAPLVHRHLGRRRPGERHPWWAPPDQLDAGQVRLLGLLAAASMSAAFANTLFTQTVNFAAKSFGVGDFGQGVSGVAVRVGVVIALPFAVLADRVGRRRMIVLTAWLTPICCAAGALAPTFPILVATQTIGRPLGLALALLVTVAVTEDMPRNTRAYALSLLAMAAGLGAGIAVMALPLADVGGDGGDGWRLVYVVSLLWLLVAVSVGRGLEETRRFVARHPVRPAMPHRRLALVGVVAVTSNLFVAPASFFQNRYLDDIRGLGAGGIAIFTLCTATPAGVGLIIGGRLADVAGRRKVIALSLPLATVLLALAFAVSGPALWACAIAGGIFSGIAYPAMQVYRAELFPTGNRGTANGLLTAISLAGGSAGLLAVGAMRNAGWSYAAAMGLMSIGQLTAAAIATVTYPETAHLELEEINPGDALSAQGLDPIRHD